MFQFTTTNVINSNKGFVDKAPFWSELDATDERGASLNIKKVGNFVSDFVKAIYKAEPQDPIFADAVLDLSTLTDAKDGDLYRLNIYLRLSLGSMDPLYADDSYYHGKPFAVDFVWKDSAALTAKKLADTIKKFQLNIHGEKMLDIKANGTTLEIKAVNEFQRFHVLLIEKLDRKANFGMGEFTVVAEAKPVDDPEYDGKNVINEQGEEGFGTYEFILHNLRIPTTARTGFMPYNAEETPIPGVRYIQYTIHYCVNRGVLGTNAVGDEVTSHTTHVLYVNEDIAPDFEAALVKIAPDNEIKEVKPKHLD